MKKHLIIHGNEVSGKSVFINTLLQPRIKHVEKINGKGLKLSEDNFLWTLGDFRPKFLWFEDLNLNTHPEEFLPFTENIKVNAQMQEVFYISPTLIIEYSGEFKNLPKESWFTRRFAVFNTNTCTYKDLIDYLKIFNDAKY
jgi:hypothetical protein